MTRGLAQAPVSGIGWRWRRAESLASSTLRACPAAAGAAPHSVKETPVAFPGEGAALPWDEQLRPKAAYFAIREALR